MWDGDLLVVRVAFRCVFFASSVNLFNFTTTVDLMLRKTYLIVSIPAFLLMAFLYSKSSPFLYYVYSIFPILFWTEAFILRHHLVLIGVGMDLSAWTHAFVYVVGLEVLVRNFVMFLNRECFLFSMIFAFSVDCMFTVSSRFSAIFIAKYWECGSCYWDFIPLQWTSNFALKIGAD